MTAPRRGSAVVAWAARHRRKLAVIAGVGLACVAWFVWWWQYSGSLFPLAERVEGPNLVFTLGAPVPVPRTEASGTACDGRFYLLGGIGAFAGTHTSFLEYFPETDDWIERPDAPEPLNHAGMVSANGKVYVVGGFGPLGLRLRGFMFARWNPVDSVHVYDPATEKWSEGAPMPAARGAGGIAVADGAIWYVGGINPERKIDARLFRYDLAADAWEEREPMPTPRDHLRMEAVGGFLYAISGRKDDLRHNLANVERYDIARRQWTRVADIPVARGGLGSAVIDGRIYTFGGEHVWTCFDTVECYDPATDAWAEVGKLPEARHGICAGVIDGRIHLVSGGRRPRVSISGIHRILEVNE